MTRGKRAARRAGKAQPDRIGQAIDRELRRHDWRGSVAWHMGTIDVLIGHDLLGFDYPIDGDARPNRSRAAP